MTRPAILLAIFALFMPRESAGIDKKILIPAGIATVGTNIETLKSQLAGTRSRVEWYSDETPERKIEVGAFLIDSTEVTNAEFATLFKDHTYPPNLANHPAVNVTWDDAALYCRDIGGRLPTEPEWERAARGDAGHAYPWGDDFNENYAVFGERSAMGADARVGSYKIEESGSTLLGGTSTVASIELGKSQFGVYDMAGNVWEWVDGWYDEDKKLRMLKGGSWVSPGESIRSSTRLGENPSSRFNDYGFRCAYSIDR